MIIAVKKDNQDGTACSIAASAPGPSVLLIFCAVILSILSLYISGFPVGSLVSSSLPKTGTWIDFSKVPPSVNECVNVSVHGTLRWSGFPFKVILPVFLMSTCNPDYDKEVTDEWKEANQLTLSVALYRIRYSPYWFLRYCLYCLYCSLVVIYRRECNFLWITVFCNTHELYSMYTV